MLTFGILAGLRGRPYRFVGASHATFLHSPSLAAASSASIAFVGPSQPWTHNNPCSQPHKFRHRHRLNGHVSALLSTRSGDYGPSDYGPSDDVEIIADGIIMGTKIDYDRDFFGGPEADMLLGLKDEANEDVSAVGSDEDCDAILVGGEDVGSDEDCDAILVGGEDVVESGTVTLEGGDLIITSGEQPMPSSSSTDIKQLQKQLKEELREYRMKQSKPIGKPPYSVFTNAAMEEICDTLPTTTAELLDVKGIGPKKLEMFGDDILNIVSKYASNSDLMEAKEKAKSKIKPTLPPRVAPIDPKSLSDEQRRAAEVPLEQKCNAFITGAAGTGKSYVLKYLIQEMHNRGIRYGIAAPTGVAAVNVGGSTLHSFFGIGLGNGSIPTLIKKVKKNKEAVKRIDEMDVLCIDEVSMLSSILLEKIDAVAREIRNNGANGDVPFGGMQIIAFGDFYQLAPIQTDYDAEDRDFRPFCFDSHVWAELELDRNTFELKEIQRQEDKTRFVQFLNMVRVGEVTERILQDFNAKCCISPSHPLPTDGIVPTRLYVLNKDVDRENEMQLAKLKGKEVICRARNEWREKMPIGTSAATKRAMKDSLEKEMPEEVRLKVGAQVMLTRNKDLDRGLVNGSRGVVERFLLDADGDQVPIVRFDNGLVEKVAKAESVRYNPEGDQGCLVRRQVPITLAWAVSESMSVGDTIVWIMFLFVWIEYSVARHLSFLLLTIYPFFYFSTFKAVHKSQGVTLTRALLDISSAFEYGQCYVALSRVRTIDGLWLERPASLAKIHVSPQVREYYGNIGRE